jgi:hypothetical protein
MFSRESKMAYRWVVFILGFTFSMSAGAVDLKDLSIPPSRIATWYEFDETVYNQAQSWPEYDVTCENAPCGSGKNGFRDMGGDPLSACTAVTTSSIANINCMIADADDDVVLYIPAGTYDLTGDNTGPDIARSNIVIRGAGAANTILERSGYGRTQGANCPATKVHHMTACGPSSAVNENWTAGYSRGDTVITVADGTTFTAGNWVVLRMDTGTACEYQDVYAGDGPYRHIAKISSINVNDLTIDRGLRMDYDGTGCTGHKVYTLSPLEYVGVEDLALVNDSALYRGANNVETEPKCTDAEYTSCLQYQNLAFDRVVDSWIVGTRLEYSRGKLLTLHRTVRSWVQGNRFHDLNPVVAFQQNAIQLPYGSNDNIVENNVFTDMRVAGKLDAGAEGNIIAYNYTRHGDNACERSFMGAHGRYVRENLFEGNDVDCNLLLADDYFGRNGPYSTAYRNRNVSTTCAERGDNVIGTDCYVKHGVDWPTATYLNVIGNTSEEIMNTPVLNSGTCAAEGSNGSDDLSTCTPNAWFEKNAYRKTGGSTYDSFDIGSSNNRSCGIAENDSCPGTNKNVSAPDASWTGNYPTSFYRSSSPSWWCAEACEWSQSGIGAFGDDFGGALCELPAEMRYESTSCTPALEGTQVWPFSGVSLMGGSLE